jgi:hypothetical protein
MSPMEGLVGFAVFCAQNKPVLTRELDAEETRSLLRCVEIVSQWVEQLTATLEPSENPPERVP